MPIFSSKKNQSTSAFPTTPRVDHTEINDLQQLTQKSEVSSKIKNHDEYENATIDSNLAISTLYKFIYTKKIEDVKNFLPCYLRSISNEKNISIKQSMGDAISFIAEHKENNSLELLLNHCKEKKILETAKYKLFSCMRKGDIDTVEIFLKYDVHLHALDSNEDTAPMHAIAEKNQAAIDVLIKYGEDIQIANLMLAAKRGDLEEIKKLHKENADIQTIGQRNLTALKYFMGGPYIRDQEDTRVATVNFLLDNGSRIDYTKQHIDYALHAAASKKFNDILNSLLMRSDLNVNAKNQLNQTVLLISTTSNNIQAVSSLVTRKDLNINVVDKNGVSALMHAIRHKQTDIVEILTENGADLTIAKMMVSANVSPCPSCPNCDSNKNYIYDLKEQGYDINTPGPGEWTTLMYAAFNGNTELMQWLLSNGADKAAINQDGFNALMLTVRNSKEAKVIATLNPTDADIQTAKLMIAAYNGNFQELKSIEFQVKNAQNDGRHAMHQYAMTIDENGNKQAKLQWTTLTHATHNDHDKLIECILDEFVDFLAQEQATYELADNLNSSQSMGSEDTIEAAIIG